MKLGRRVPCGEWNEVTIQKYDISATRERLLQQKGEPFSYDYTRDFSYIMCL